MYGLFNDIVNISDSTASDDGMVNRQLNRNYVERSGRDLIKAAVPELAWRD
jgi:hypothetical protein